ncbi:P-loop containing nucleoside triphosphate hydrolase protein [Meredithblackwellia eburnea MCA 4105]
MSAPLPTTEEVQGFIKRLIELTERERQVEEEESRLLFTSCPFNLLEKRGLGLGNLAITKTSIGLGGKTLIDLERPGHLHSSPIFPPHSFRPGDLAALEDPAASSSKIKSKAVKHGPALEGVVFKVLETKVVVALNRRGGEAGKDEDFELPERVRLLKVANPSTFDRQVRTLEHLLRKLLPAPNEDGVEGTTAKEIKPPTPLVGMLLGIEPLPTPASPTPLTLFDPLLNNSQKEAISFALGPSSTISLIWGPPGTGKTQTLVEIIRQLVASNQRVLVCGASNLSVDNVLQRLSFPHPELAPIPLTRIGHPARVLNALVEHTLDSQSLRTDAAELLSGIKEELGGLEARLSGTGKSRIRGKERKEKWEEVRALRKEYRKREGGVVGEVLKKARVVLATCHGAGSRSLENEAFDVVIIDEAAQAVEPACWIPILKGKKLILAGDHLQLPPTIKSLNGSQKKPKPVSSEPKVSKTKDAKGKGSPTPPEPTPPSVEVAVDSKDKVLPHEIPNSACHEASAIISPESEKRTLTTTNRLRPSSTLELTLFSRLLELHGSGIRRMLKTQYRFNAKIMAFPSEALYDNELVAADNVKDRILSDLSEVEKDEDLDEPVVFIDTAGAGMFERKPTEDENALGADSKSNENEASLVVDYVNTLISSNVPSNAIAIVSPYNSQVSLLASLIHPEHPEVEIASIDSFQGREQECVIISLVRSNEEGEVGFLKEKRRLNVAMTRPRRQLVVVGDSSTVSKGSSYLKKWMSWLEENADVRVAQ